MITIVVLIVILSIIALIVILLHFSLTIFVHIGDGGLSVKAKYLWFDLYPRKPKKKKQKTKSKKLKNKKTPEPITEEHFNDDFTDDFDDEISDYELMHGVSPEHEEKLIEKSEQTADSAPDTEESEPSAKAEKKYDFIKSEKPSEPKKSEKKERSSKSKEDKSEKGGLRGKIADLRATYEKYKPYIPTTWKYARKLFRSIRIRIDSAHIQIGREDAHEAAIYYGAVQGVIANLLSFLSEFFTVNVKRLDVDCVFTENTLDGEADISIRVRPSALIAIAACFGVKFLIIKLKEKNQSDKLPDEEPQTA